MAHLSPRLLPLRVGTGHTVAVGPTADDFDDEEALAEYLLEQWAQGEGTAKSKLEQQVWDDGSSHGRRFDRFVYTTLGITTSRPSKQSTHIEELQSQIRRLGSIPEGEEPEDWQRHVQHAREACLSALKVWNDPAGTFRTGAFSLLLVTTWNALAIAKLDKAGEQWWKDEPGADGEVLSLETRTLLTRAFDGEEYDGLRRNVRFWLKLRNAVAHRHLPALDISVIPWAQAGLLNVEEVLVDEFGPDFGIAASLSVPLQLSGFRDPGVLSSLRRLQAALPLDVQAILSQANSVDDAVLQDTRYMLRVAFVPAVPPSGRNPDAVAYFVKPGEVPDELDDVLDRYVVLPKPMVGSRPNKSTSEVMNEVKRRTGFKFHSQLHAAAARSLGAWPANGEATATQDIRYAEYIVAHKRWVYSQAWIDHLVSELSDPGKFEEITGKPATPVPAD